MNESLKQSKFKILTTFAYKIRANNSNLHILKERLFSPNSASGRHCIFILYYCVKIIIFQIDRNLQEFSQGNILFQFAVFFTFND